MRFLSKWGRGEEMWIGAFPHLRLQERGWGGGSNHQQYQLGGGELGMMSP